MKTADKDKASIFIYTSKINKHRLERDGKQQDIDC